MLQLSYFYSLRGNNKQFYARDRQIKKTDAGE